MCYTFIQLHHTTVSDQKPSNKKGEICCCCNSHSEFWQQHQILSIYFMLFWLQAIVTELAFIYYRNTLGISFFRLTEIRVIFWFKFWFFCCQTYHWYENSHLQQAWANAVQNVISTNIGKTICVGTLWLVQPFQAKWKLHVVMKCYVDAQFWSTTW